MTKRDREVTRGESGRIRVIVRAMQALARERVHVVWHFDQPDLSRTMLTHFTRLMTRSFSRLLFPSHKIVLLLGLASTSGVAAADRDREFEIDVAKIDVAPGLSPAHALRLAPKTRLANGVRVITVPRLPDWTW